MKGLLPPDSRQNGTRVDRNGRLPGGFPAGVYARIAAAREFFGFQG